MARGKRSGRVLCEMQQEGAKAAADAVAPFEEWIGELADNILNDMFNNSGLMMNATKKRPSKESYNMGDYRIITNSTRCKGGTTTFVYLQHIPCNEKGTYFEMGALTRPIKCQCGIEYPAALKMLAKLKVAPL